MIDLGICAFVGISFVLTGNFSFEAYSNRLFWIGIGAGILGGLILIGIGLVGVGTGIRGLKDPGVARAMMEHDLQKRSEREERYDMCIQMWVIGLTCIGLSVLIGALSAQFMI